MVRHTRGGVGAGETDGSGVGAGDGKRVGAGVVGAVVGAGEVGLGVGAAVVGIGVVVGELLGDITLVMVTPYHHRSLILSRLRNECSRSW